MKERKQDFVYHQTVSKTFYCLHKIDFWMPILKVALHYYLFETKYVSKFMILIVGKKYKNI